MVVVGGGGHQGEKDTENCSVELVQRFGEQGGVQDSDLAQKREKAKTCSGRELRN